MPREGTAELTELDHRERGARPGADGGHELVDAVAGQIVQQCGSDAEWQRIGRIHRHLAERRRRHHREGVHRRSELAHRTKEGSAVRLAPEEGAVDDCERATAHRLGHEWRVGASSVQAWSTSAARSKGKNITPAYSSSTG